MVLKTISFPLQNICWPIFGSPSFVFYILVHTPEFNVYRIPSLPIITIIPWVILSIIPNPDNISLPEAQENVCLLVS